jgi:large subunit ribosomal protein L25
MLSLNVEKRSEKKLRDLRNDNLVPAVLYGPEIDNLNLEVDLVEFEKIHEKAGDSSLISLKLGKKDYLVLIRDTQFAPVSGNPIHVDFYQPPLKEEVEVEVSVIFEGESLAVKNEGGTLVKNLSELPVKALPQKLPKEIRVDISSLKTFDDKILISDLVESGDFEILKDPSDVVASVSRPEEIKEEEEIELGEMGEMGEMDDDIEGIDLGDDVKEESSEEEEKPKEE